MSWVRSPEGAEAKLRAGARVAVIGCGRGTATIHLARTFTASTLHGFDHRSALVEEARRAAAEAGVSERVTFEVAPTEALPGRGYDLVAMLDQTRAGWAAARTATRVGRALAVGGRWVLALTPEGERPFRGAAADAGLGRVRRVSETPAAVVLEIRCR